MARPYEQMAFLRPRRGEVLVRRARRGYIWEGLIQIPDSYLRHVKNANALVIKIGEGVDLPDLELGDVVFIAHGVSRRVEFEEPPGGDTAWEPIVYSCRQNEIIANLGACVLPTYSEDGPESFRRESEARRHAEDRSDEGAL